MKEEFDFYNTSYPDNYNITGKSQSNEIIIFSIKTKFLLI